ASGCALPSRALGIVPLCAFFFFQAEDGIRDATVTGVQTCALPISFGLRLGLESIGLYGPGGVRGFNPQSAGNVRIDGLYFDQQRSEERRVGKEGRSRRSARHPKQKT